MPVTPLTTNRAQTYVIPITGGSLCTATSRRYGTLTLRCGAAAVGLAVTQNVCFYNMIYNTTQACPPAPWAAQQ